MNEKIHGNSFELLPTIADNIYDAVITDVPYDLKQQEKEFLHSEFIRVCKDTILVFSPPENQYLFWQKPISTKNTSKRYSRFVEMIFLYQLTLHPTWNCERHWSQYTNIFLDLVDDTKLHAFRKPPSLIERLILNHTNEGDCILDPFAGSFVVAEVANRLGRNCVSIEIEAF
jgi:DNA modification methylase